MSITLDITGMHCQACVEKLTSAFERLPGVRSATVSLSPPRAVIDGDDALPAHVLEDAARTAGNYSVSAIHRGTAPGAPDAAAPSENTATKPSLYPLALIIAFILGLVALTSFVRTDAGWHSFMLDFMAGFFLVFAFFKLLDLRGFADAYQSYDIVARRSRTYAFVYPFIELALGVAYLLRWQLQLVNAFTLALMLVSSIGVVRAVMGDRRIRCACLGTALNLPMTTVTIVEDLGMAAMAVLMLLWPH